MLLLQYIRVQGAGLKAVGVKTLPTWQLEHFESGDRSDRCYEDDDKRICDDDGDSEADGKHDDGDDGFWEFGRHDADEAHGD